jgi:hypothetical protein
MGTQGLRSGLGAFAATGPILPGFVIGVYWIASRPTNATITKIRAQCRAQCKDSFHTSSCLRVVCFPYNMAIVLTTSLNNGAGAINVFVPRADAPALLRLVASGSAIVWHGGLTKEAGYPHAETIDAPDEKVSTLREKLGIVRSEMRFAGLPIIDFLAVVFGMVALGRGLSPDTVPANPRAAAIDSRTLLMSATAAIT